MNPNDPPSQTPSPRGLRALPSLPPKRRCKAAETLPEENDLGSVIVPFYNPLPKPAKFTRSGKPFQIWKESKVVDPAPRKTGLQATIGGPVQGYARSMSFLLLSRLHNSP